MSTKSIITWLVIIIVVVVGGYLIYANMKTPQAAQQNQQQQATTTAEQVQGQDVKVGSGAEATPGSIVSVLYVGKLSDGTTFDSSAAHGNQPLKFALGTQGLIPGFQIGVNGMKVGGERQIIIPPSLGYGTQDVKDANGKVVIPANSTLYFDLQLVNVEAASTTPTQNASTTSAH